MQGTMRMSCDHLVVLLVAAPGTSASPPFYKEENWYAEGWGLQSISVQHVARMKIVMYKLASEENSHRSGTIFFVNS